MTWEPIEPVSLGHTAHYWAYYEGDRKDPFIHFYRLYQREERANFKGYFYMKDWHGSAMVLIKADTDSDAMDQALVLYRQWAKRHFHKKVHYVLRDTVTKLYLGISVVHWTLLECIGAAQQYPTTSQAEFAVTVARKVTTPDGTKSDLGWEIVPVKVFYLMEDGIGSVEDQISRGDV